MEDCAGTYGVYSQWSKQTRQEAFPSKGRTCTHIFADPRLTQELQQLQLSQRPQAKHRVVERRDLLDGDLTPTGSVYCRADDTVRPLADDI